VAKETEALCRAVCADGYTLAMAGVSRRFMAGGLDGTQSIGLGYQDLNHSI